MIAVGSGCESVSNTNANNANLRGQNTNTAYVTNANDTAKPTVPANATNITPGNVPMPSTNTNTNSNMRPMNSNMNKNMTPTPRP